MGGLSDEGGDLFSPRTCRNSAAVSGQLECGATPGPGTSSAANWLGTCPAMGRLLFALPSMPISWPFGYLKAITLISMLSVSYAWTVLLAAHNWKELDAIPHSFLVILAFLILWWGTEFSAIGWMLTEASAPPPFRGVPLGVFATIDRPHLGVLT